ncbi:TPA: hypothetical protein N0F65_008064 [Lagenidium giganteum]|uniref:Transposase n=1 Tax=Lagenidium giganteum TaxID=4803 RepID=A0AAV2YRU7_9STRA|nr:TPA: hypothetical protein N0F65_008064 [Lagenidium giganteum]
MTVSTDLRWRAIVLTFIYGTQIEIVASVLGVSICSIGRWYALFQNNGNVLPRIRFMAWASTPGTFDRSRFHDAFQTHIAPLLNPWPLPRSIVVIDNSLVHRVGGSDPCARCSIFLPPHAPHLTH